MDFIFGSTGQIRSKRPLSREEDVCDLKCYFCKKDISVPRNVFDVNKKSTDYKFGGIRDEFLHSELDNGVYISGEELIYCERACWSNLLAD